MKRVRNINDNQEEFEVISMMVVHVWEMRREKKKDLEMKMFVSKPVWRKIPWNH